MGLFDRLFGGGDQQQADTRPAPPQAPARAQNAQSQGQARSDDDIAIERYRYLLRTAPPERIEQVHAEAFEKLTPEQRRQVYTQLSENAPAGEAPQSDDPQALAGAATRAELRQPGTMERSFGGPGFGSMLGASLLGTVAGYVIGSALMSAFLPPMDGGDVAGGEGDTGAEGDAGADGGADAGADASGGDFGGGDFGGGDFGGGFDF
jgi:hypothetical protein